MKIVFDPSADSAYVELSKAEGPVETYELPDGPGRNRIWLDFDETGRLVGIEVLNASHFLPPHLLATAGQNAAEK
ncbi:MAG TPA: DUF2283 domain-containing protein [Chloroflexota bacterium]|nr:DUF2283 domain-containing protein [Chloroflexota bacterium]